MGNLTLACLKTCFNLRPLTVENPVCDVQLLYRLTFLLYTFVNISGKNFNVQRESSFVRLEILV